MGSKFDGFPWIFLILCYISGVNSLIDISEEVFGTKNNGVIAAYGDYDSDKLTDLFVLTNDGKRLLVFLASDKAPYLSPSRIQCDLTKGKITSVVGADFDGDSQMDVLVTVAGESGANLHEVKILWGSQNELNCSFDHIATTTGQPLVLDYNGDKIPDLLAESEKGDRQILLFSSNGNFSTVNVSRNTDEKFRIPHSNTFIDLNRDLIPDLLISTTSGYELWYNQNGKWKASMDTSYPMLDGVKIVGQTVIVDIDLDGAMNHLVPVCFDSDCKNSSILVRINDKWCAFDIAFENGNLIWGFVPPDAQHSEIGLDTISLRVGDFDLDGYPDLLGILRSNPEHTDTRAFLLQNSECVNCAFSRTFTVIWNSEGLRDVKDVVSASFYDVYNDGMLDVLLVRRASDGTNVMKAFQNNYDNNACFIKVIVLSGLCYMDCPNKKVPYGVNQVGPSICYTTTTPDGKPQSSCAGQLSQSAHFSLQLPYVVFGLGHTPNFVDTLRIGVPGSLDKPRPSYGWTSIIPNSQMFVIPQLITDNNSWINKLFVTPSHLVLITFAALMGFMGLIMFIILGLHLKERQEDKKEKLQESHRFHFDAM